MKSTKLSPKQIERCIKTLLKLLGPYRAGMIFDFLHIKRSEISRASKRSKGFVSEVLNGNEKSRPLEEEAYKLLQRKLKKLCPEYCPTFEEVFAYGKHQLNYSSRKTVNQ